MNPCDNLISFIDGELSEADADTFREHLRTCEVCSVYLADAVELTARLSTLSDDAAPWPRSEPASEGRAAVQDGRVLVFRAAGDRVAVGEHPAAERLGAAVPAELHVGEPGSAHARQESPLPVLTSRGPGPDPRDPIQPSVLNASPPHLPAPWRNHAAMPAVVAAVASVAAVVICVGSWNHVSPPPASAFPVVKSRPYEVRLAYAGAADHHPAREVMLGAGAAPDNETIPLETLATLQKRGDAHGVAIASLWNGARPSDVAKKLSAIPQTEPVRSDRAAMAVLTTTAANAEPVLAELEALRSSHDQLVSHAARWNYALLLVRLELPLSAGQAFHAIASEHEAGWSEEASALAAQQEQLGHDFKSNWQRAVDAGEALIRTGALVSSDLVTAFPGIMRAYFYNAVRTAPSASRVLALMPMATLLDQRTDPNVHSLSDYVQRVAKLDFARRSPLAAGYAALLHRAPIDEAMTTQLTTETDSSDIADIVMGAIIERDLVAGHRAWFQRMVDAARDPWFQIVLANAEADAEIARGNWLGTEALLHETEKRCTSPLSYQCLVLERRLGTLYAALHRTPEALNVLRRAVQSARGLEEWGRYQNLLLWLADVERFHGATATVRAFSNELLLMSDETDCKTRSHIYRRLTGAAILDADGSTARRHLGDAMALSCAKVDLPAAAYLSDIAGLDPQPDDLLQERRMLETLRSASKLTAAERILADTLEGRTAIAVDLDRTASTARLKAAITAADQIPGEILARQARAAAYTTLVVDAAKAGDAAAALGLVAESLHLAPPRDCTVSLAAEGKHAAVVIRGADGKDHASYHADWVAKAGTPAIAPDLLQQLTACSRIGVMASATLQGQSGVLPPELPWSYLTGAHGPDAAVNPADGAPHTLIITNVTPPPYLELPPLSSKAPDDVPATMLLGAEATPSRVLTAMADATEIQFHTHALLDVGVSDASHLVLSPERSGTYALTAEAIRKIKLARQPIVVLESCHSAVGARYEHEPWSLPDAFLAAGARAVFAATTEIPDVASGRFFAKVLARVRAGTLPAVALRDERIAALRADPSNQWVSGVILFE